MADLFLGIDFGGTSVKLGVCDSRGAIRGSASIPTRAELKPGDMIDLMGDAADRLMETTGRAAACGSGVPGPLDLERKTLLKATNLPTWVKVPYPETLGKRLGMTTFMENDANCAAWGEFIAGAGRGMRSLVLYTLGTGVGGGIVINGDMWVGASGAAGELGHMSIDPRGPRCACGQLGCVEQYASATAVKRMAIEAIATGKAPELARAMNENLEFSAKVVFQHALQGDPSARHIFEVVGHALGLVLADMINTLNLPMYVIGGGLASGWEAFAPAMFEELRKRSYVYVATAPDETLPARKHTLITRALLGSDAGLVGAARLALM